MALPDVAGNWKCTSIEGDFGKVLEGMNVGWMKRKAASAMGFGVNKQEQTIAIDGNKMTIENRGPRKTTTATVTVDGSEQDVRVCHPTSIHECGHG